MDLRRIAVCITTVLLVGSWSAVPVYAQQQSVLPSQRHSSVQATSAVQIETLPSVDTNALRAGDKERSDRVGPYRYGTTVNTRFTPDGHGTWERLPSGRWLWRLRVRSQGAVSLSVGFSQFQLPSGTSLYLHGPGETSVHGPYTAADATAGEHWTPLIRGEEIILELEVPSGRREDVDLTIGNIVHGYRPLPGRGDAVPSKSGSCNLDVACDEADPWRRQVRSVGRYTYESDGSTFFCSGALINNTAEDRTPYFLTAEHCVSTPEEVSSMVFYWNYQNQTCRSLGSAENGTITDDDPGDQTSSGGVLRARFGNWHSMQQIEGKPDLILVRVDDEIPDSYNLYLSGWNRAAVATSEGVTIHHPQGHGKRISFDEDSTRTTGFGSSAQGSTHLRVGDWDLGTTEAGSSGGVLYNAQKRIVGVLSGGLARCGTEDPSEDNDQPDWFGRLALGFENGDYENTTFADVLDPRNTGQKTLDGLPQSEQADVTAPAPIRDLRVSRVDTRNQEVTLRWTATGDDNRSGTAQRYELRFDTTRIETAADFRQAQPVEPAPIPSEAGQPETAAIDRTDGLRLGRSYYFGIVAVDDAGNRSPRTTTERKAILVKDIEIEGGGLTVGGRSSLSETRFVLNETQDLRVTLYDVLGRRIRVLLDREVQEGFEQAIRFRTRSLASGTYFLRFKGEQFAATRKVVVMR